MPSANATKVSLSGVAIALVIFTFLPAMDHALRSGEYPLHSSLSLALLGLTILGFWIGYSTTINSTRDLTAAVIVAGLLIAAAVLSIRPFRTADVWTYVSFGWMQVRYHMSPYGHEMIDVPRYAHDPIFSMSELDELFPYGPLFAEVTRFVCRLSGANPWHAVLMLKLANFAAMATIAAMIASVATRTGSERRDITLLLFLWHPLIAIEFLGQGHNDLLAALPLVFAIFAAERDWLILVLPAIALGALVKFLPALAAPFAFVYVARRRGMRPAIASTAIAAAVCAVVAAPYLVGWTAAILRRIFTAQLTSYQTLSASLGYVIVKLLGLIPILTPRSPSHVYKAMAALAAVAFAVFYLLEIARFIREPRPDLEALNRATALVLIVFICFARMKYDAWYAGMFLPVALMLGANSRIARAAIAIGFAGLLEPAIDQYSLPVIDFALLIGIPLAWAALTTTRQS
jgi:hypothetical protein